MTFLHLILLGLGTVAAVLAADLLRHRGIGSWPIGIVVVVLIPVTGWTYSAWLAALTLGLATGFAVISGRDLLRSRQARRQRRNEERRLRAQQSSRQLEVPQSSARRHRTTQ